MLRKFRTENEFITAVLERHRGDPGATREAVECFIEAWREEYDCDPDDVDAFLHFVVCFYLEQTGQTPASSFVRH